MSTKNSLPTAALLEQDFCGGCGAEAKMKCGGCATVQYCGKQCQVAHWPTHKARCRVLKAEAAVAADEAEALRRNEEKDEEEQEVVHNPDTEAGNCWTCGADNPRNVCNRCKVTKYCGVACQTENWPIHKGRCATLKAQYSGVDAAKSELKKVKAGIWLPRTTLDADLRNASSLGRVVDIERIIAAGGSVNALNQQGIGALHGAAQEGHARAVGVLVQHGAQVNARCGDKGETALHIASHNDQPKAVVKLLELRAPVDSRNNLEMTPLYRAAQYNRPVIVILLLQWGAEVNLQDNKGFSPLSISAFEGHATVVRTLLEHGAHINAKDNDGRSALLMASMKHHFEVVALLLEKGAQVDLPTKEGDTPLGMSAVVGKVDVPRLLLEHGAKIDSRNNSGASSLYIASQSNSLQVVALLLEKGARVDLPTKMPWYSSSCCTGLKSTGLATQARPSRQHPH